MSTALRLFGLAVLLGAPPQAHADDRDWRLTWRAPEGCPDQGTVVRRIVDMLGAPGRDADLRVSANVRRDGAGWTLELVARRAEGRQRRRLHHRDCATLIEATVMLVTLAVDPTAMVDPRLAAALRSAETPPTPHSLRARPVPDTPVQPVSRAPAPWVITAVAAQDDRSAEPQDPSDPPDAPASTPTAPAPRFVAPTRRRPSLAVRVGAGAASGATPAVSGGLIGAVALTLGRHARIEILGNYWAPRRAQLGETAGPGADVSLAAGGVRGCGVLRRSRFEFPLCLGGEVGSMRATGVDLSEVRSARSLWFALVPGGAVVFAPRPRFAVWLGLDGVLALVRPQFVVDGAGEVWRAGRGGVRGWLGFEVRFRAR